MAAKRSVPSGTDLKSLYETKLKGSKLTPGNAAKLKLQLKTAALCPAELPAQAGGFVIPYFDMAGKPTKFYRYRYLEIPKRGGFDAIVQRKELRYAQPAKSANEIYLPPLVDWRRIAKDANTPLIITEGELKAACVTATTPYPCIGLGGVWVWKSANRRMPLLPQFKEFEWSGRAVFIVFDSDAVTNPMVMQAENALARALTALGAEPYVGRLPMSDDGHKVGLDDYLLEHSVEELEELLEAAPPWAQAEELHKLNEEVIYVRDPGLILRLDTLQRMSPQAFQQHAYSTRVYYEQQEGKGGSVLVAKSAPKEWLKWPARGEVARSTYEPGADRITTKGELNVWPGWKATPIKGDIKPWTQLLDYLFAGEPASRIWLERWLACALQQPGVKQYTSVLLWGLRHGSGKSLVGYTMREIYGANWVELNDDDLHATHNEWAENKQFVLGDEITGGDKRSVSDKMKGMISRNTMRINVKYIPSYTVRDCINYYFTSNHPDAFFLEDDDRRYFIHEVVGDPLPDEFYRNYEKWMLSNAGANALFYHFLTLDMGDFNPKAKAPATDAKRDMQHTGRSDLGTWCAQLKEDPDSVLRFGNKVLPFKLMRSEDLLKLYDPENKGRVTANGLSRELRRQNFPRAYRGQGVPTKTDGQIRLWAVRPIAPRLLESGAISAQIYDDERSMPSAATKTPKHR
jgi:hypothetical protein